MTDTSAAAPAPQLTPAEQEQCDLLYDQLKPEAIASARSYVLARTPANLQEAMNDKIDADFPPPPPPTEGELAARLEDANSAFRPGTPLAEAPPPPAA
jgi:hypothetical protein